jgi:hypothetical protein
VGHELKRFAARAKVVLAAIEAGDAIAYDLMVGLAGELAAVGVDADRSLEGVDEEMAGRIGPHHRLL